MPRKQRIILYLYCLGALIFLSNYFFSFLGQFGRDKRNVKILDPLQNDLDKKNKGKTKSKNRNKQGFDTFVAVHGAMSPGINSMHLLLREIYPRDFGLNWDARKGIVGWIVSPTANKNFTEQNISVFHIVQHPLFFIYGLKRELCNMTIEEEVKEKNSTLIEEQEDLGKEREGGEGEEQVIEGETEEEEEEEEEFINEVNITCNLSENELWISIQKEFSLTEYESLEMSFLEYWVKWNLKFELMFPYAELFQLEGFNPTRFIKKFSSVLETNNDRIYIPSSNPKFLLEIKQDLKSKLPFEYIEKGRENNSLIQQAVSMMERYGYTKEKPRQIKVYNYMAPDQARYLVEYLWTLDFSPSRPLRFVFENYPFKPKMSSLKDEDRQEKYMVVIGSIRTSSRNEFMRNSGKLTHAINILHKDEYCMYNNSRLFSNSLISYHGYYDEKLIDSQKVYWFPLGVKSTFPMFPEADIIPSSNRTYLCSFVGSMTSASRMKMLGYLEKLPERVGCFFYGVGEWNSKLVNYANPEGYLNMLSISSFTLSPIGHNPECYRIFEACEAGSIPIIEERDSDPHDSNGKYHYCNKSMEIFHQLGAPFIFIRDWSELQEILEYFRDNMELLDVLQEKVITWYKDFKMKFITQFENNLQSLIEHVESLKMKNLNQTNSSNETEYQYLNTEITPEPDNPSFD